MLQLLAVSMQDASAGRSLPKGAEVSRLSCERNQPVRLLPSLTGKSGSAFLDTDKPEARRGRKAPGQVLSAT